MFRKGFSSWQCLIVLIEKLKKSGMSKARYNSNGFIESFSCLLHDLQIAKNRAYISGMPSLNHLLIKWQREGKFFGVLQGSINIFFSEIFL